MKEKILELLKINDGVLTTKEVRKNNIDTTYLSLLVKDGILIRQGRGVYINANDFGDEYFALSAKSSYCTFSHSTALYFHGLSDRTPIKYNITFPHGYTGNSSFKSNVKVNLYYIKKNNFELGRMKIKSPQGKEVYVYNVERTLCDMLRSENRVDKNITIAAFKQYLKFPEKDLYKLKKYAKILHVSKKLNKYLEVLL